jgi:hypothetical protein
MLCSNEGISLKLLTIMLRATALRARVRGRWMLSREINMMYPGMAEVMPMREAKIKIMKMAIMGKIARNRMMTCQ